jgi:hypothetical protein
MPNLIRLLDVALRLPVAVQVMPSQMHFALARMAARHFQNIGAVVTIVSEGCCQVLK